jgi:hypothetical protein
LRQRRRGVEGALPDVLVALIERGMISDVAATLKSSNGMPTPGFTTSQILAWFILIAS